MQTINITDPTAFQKAAIVLKNSGLVMHPTETCYGFAVDIGNEKALSKLFRIKGREKGKPLSILVDSLEMAQQYGIFSDKALELARKYWPGPLTLVVPKGSDFVGIRFSDNEFCIAMVREFGKPVITTSANVSGKEPLYRVDLEQFGELADEIDLIIDGGELPENKPSTVMKVMGDEVQVLRQGA